MSIPHRAEQSRAEQSRAEQSRAEQSSRIEFIDLAKGVCILLVVMGHCGLQNSIQGMEIVRMPLYFILSGLFFKTYTTKEFFIKKTNSLLIPFCFFAFTSILGAFLSDCLSNSHEINRSLHDQFWGYTPFYNGPIWFLMALFWCVTYAYFIFKYVKLDIFRIITIILAGVVGCYLGLKEVHTPLYMSVGLTSLPYFAVGYYLKQINVLQPNKYDKYNAIYVILLYSLAFLLSSYNEGEFDLLFNTVTNPIIQFPLGIISAIALLLLCKQIKQLPLLSYIGRYSIIILCTHYIFRDVFSRLLFHLNGGSQVNPWLVFFVVMVASIAMVPICIKFIPWFVAQRDLIKITK